MNLFIARQVLQGVLTMLMQELPMMQVIESIILIMTQISLVKKEVKIAVPLKYLSNFWRTLNMPLINCEVSLILTWSENCVIISLEKRIITNAQRDTSPTNATFKTVRSSCYFVD